jgi:hypothetical protein
LRAIEAIVAYPARTDRVKTAFAIPRGIVTRFALENLVQVFLHRKGKIPVIVA